MKKQKHFILMGILLVIGILIFYTVNALEWPFNKTQTCDSFNITGESCETFWCNSIQGGTYNATRELCVFTNTINNTVIINQSINSTSGVFNSSVYLNKTQVEEYSLNQTLFMRDTLLETMENRTRLWIKDELAKSSYGVSNSVNNGPSDNVFYVGIAAVVFLIVFLVFMRSKQQPQQNQARPFRRGNLPRRPGTFVGIDDSKKEGKKTEKKTRDEDEEDFFSDDENNEENNE